MSDINVFVDDQQMTVTNNPVIASGGVNEDYVVFTFSEEWDDFEKVACFYKDGDEENVVEMLIDQDNKALIPHEVTDEPGKFWFGVVGIKNDITYTSEVLWYDLRKGIYEKESRSATADIYVQMLELAQQIVEHLNNTPYVTYEEDDEFELPIHTINDSAISNESTWSSAKLQEEFEGVIYTISGQNNTCNKTYSEIMAILNEKIPKITIKHGASINYVDYAIKVLNMGLIISARTNEGKVTIEHSNDDTISVTFTVEHFQDDIDALEDDIESINTTINSHSSEISNIQWKWAFNITSNDGVKYIDFTDKATSTMLILTQHDTNADCNSLFLVRKTASDNQDAMILGNAGGIIQSGSSNMPVRATVVDVQGLGKRIAIRSQNGGAAMVYYQIIE